MDRENGVGRRDGAHKYRMRQRLVSIGDDFWIEDEGGRRVYKVDGKALRIRKTLIFEDAGGHELLKIQKRLLHIKNTMEIEDAQGHSVATVKKALVTPFRDRWSVHLAGGGELHVQGNLLEHEYRIEDERGPVAAVSKQWFRIADTYGVEIEPGQNDVVILAVTAALDQMAHPLR